MAGFANSDAVQPHRRRCLASHAGVGSRGPGNPRAGGGCLDCRQRRTPASGQGPGHSARWFRPGIAAVAGQQPVGDSRQGAPGGRPQGSGPRAGYRRPGAVPRPGAGCAQLFPRLRCVRPEFRSRTVRHGAAGGHGRRRTLARHGVRRSERSGRGRGHPVPLGRCRTSGPGPATPGCHG
ncbi:hypothetical protein D3C71_1482870 [compost metagenome]